MVDIDAEMLAEFVTEAQEALTEMDLLIEEIQSDSPGTGAYDALFRQVHAIKGTASFVQLVVLTRLAHASENLLDALRHRELDRSPERVALLADAVDTFHFCLNTLSSGEEESLYEERVQTISNLLDEDTQRSSRRGDEARVHSVRPALPSARPQAASEAPMSLSATLMMPDLVEKFCVEAEEQLSAIELTLLSWEQGRANTDMLEEAFRNMHSLKGNCGIMGLPDMEMVTHNMETTFSEWSQGKSTPHQSQVTAILTVLDVLRRALQLLPEGAGRLTNRDQLIDALNVTASEHPPQVFLTNMPPAADGEGSAPKPRAAGLPTPEVSGGTERVSSSIRVDTRKLDELMNLVGELIIAETTVTHNPDLEGHEFENFQKAALNLNRITRQLQDVTMQARMVPIDTTFQKMHRLVRDVSNKQGKNVNLTMKGEETEVDKSVIETIGDPLIHLIRNGIDHGLEDSSGRAAANKSETGNLSLSAHHQGGEVWISVADDGRGIDPEKVLASAIKKGVADPEKTYTRDEILHMVFAPGFSTAAQVTDISGRGVGMDVVKKNIERVNGRIDIDTKVGRGTTFTLRIPLTLAIIEGMLVRVGGSYFTIPLLSIMESVKATNENLTTTSDGQELLRLRDRHYPITKLADLSGNRAATQDISQGILVVVESEGQQACVLVDEVIGQRQTVIKPLPDYLRNIRTLGGCSILHNGDISLILDIDALVRRSQKQAAA